MSRFRFCIVVLLACLAAGCGSKPSAPFVDQAASAGIDFVHFNGMSGELYFVEMMGAGAALFDYDNDGDLDIYMVQGHVLRAGEALAPPLQAPPLVDRIYRNESNATEIRFTDVTDASGIEAGGYGMGVACGDVDNDGATDLYVTNFGTNQLWRNRGDGTFADITDHSGTGDARWTVSASMVDYDRDGLLDIYAGNYVDFRFTNHKPCRSASSARDYCSPLVYEPQPDALFNNRGGGRFADVTADSGVSRAFGGALGVSSADFDRDGWLDIYVANDGLPNQLWMNQADGRFVDMAPLAGVAVNMDGQAEASMGVDAGDFDGDGDDDLFMTHLSRETNTLYVNNGDGWFEDRSVRLGLAAASLSYTGFGTAWIDYDNDGDLDLLSVNGAVTQIKSQADAGIDLPLRQNNQLFENNGDGTFDEITARAGAAFSHADVSRGAAFGDIDNDGDIDVLVSNNNSTPNLLVNKVGQSRQWLGLRLLTAENGRDDLGARVAVGRDKQKWRRARSDGSYASCNDPRVLFGLGDDSTPQDVTVNWSDGGSERWSGLETGRYHTLIRGSGRE